MTTLRSVCAVASAVTLVGAVGCASAPRERPIRTTPVAQGPGTLQEARKFLEGRWSLLSFEVFPPGKQPVALKGSGVLTYDDFGNLRIEIRVDEDGESIHGVERWSVPESHGARRYDDVP